MLARWIRTNKKRGDFLWASFGGDTHHAVSEWLAQGIVELGRSCNLQMSWPIEQPPSFWQDHLERSLQVFDVPLDWGYGGLLLTWPPTIEAADGFMCSCMIICCADSRGSTRSTRSGTTTSASTRCAARVGSP